MAPRSPARFPGRAAPAPRRGVRARPGRREPVRARSGRREPGRPSPRVAPGHTEVRADAARPARARRVRLAGVTDRDRGAGAAAVTARDMRLPSSHLLVEEVAAMI